MLQRASERRVIPENSPHRQTREELQPDPRMVVNQQRSPTQIFQPQIPPPPPPPLPQQQQHQQQQQQQQQQHQAFPFAHHHRLIAADAPPHGFPIAAHAAQWYDPTIEYADPEANAWATMELNTGAVAVNGMEAYMIPVGYVSIIIGFFLSHDAETNLSSFDQQQESLPQIW